MSLDLRHLVALKDVRARREERMSRLRSDHARQCAQIEQRVLDARRSAERLACDVKQRQDGRWQALFSGTFDRSGLLAASLQDDFDGKCIEQADHGLQNLMRELGEAKAQWEHAVADHVKALRKLETWREFVDGECRARTRRDELRSESAQDDAHGARYAS